MRAAVLCAAAFATAAPAAAASVDYGPISHKGFKTVGAASTSLKLPLQLGFDREPVRPAERGQVGEQPGVVLLWQVPVAVDAAEQVRRLVVEAQGGRERVQVQRDHGDGRRHPPARERDGQRRQGAEDVRDQVEGLQDEHGLEGGAAGEHAEAAERDQGQRRHRRRDARAASSGSSSSAARAAVVADGGTPTRTGTPAFGCVPTTFPAALGSGSGLYPNQILTAYGIAPLQAAGLKGQGVAAGDRRRGADAGLGREHVPLVLRHAGDVAEDPQRRLDQADPRELARRDGRLDGGARAVALRPVGAPDQRERRRRRRRGLPADARPAAAGDDQRHPAART